MLLFEKYLIRQDDVLSIRRYEKIDLIRPENYDKLLSDLRVRTGLNVYQAEVERINFLNDTARLKIFYKKDLGSKHNIKSEGDDKANR